MERSQLLNALLVLLIIIAALFLAQMLWQLLSGFADLILLFLLGWLVSFILNPVVAQVSRYPVPPVLLNVAQPLLGRERVERLAARRLSRGAAVAIVYLVLLFGIVAALALFVPAAAAQLSQLGRHLPEYAARVSALSASLQDLLNNRLNIKTPADQYVSNILGGLQNVAAGAIQNVLGIFTGAVNLVADLFVVLILGFYITLDGPRLRRSIFELIPAQYQDEVQFFGQSVERTFGGFIRGQLIQAVLVGIGTAIAMTLVGLDFVLIASFSAALLMLIPLVGPFLALIPPLFVALLQMPDLFLWLLVALFVYQFVIVNVLMPRLLSESLGLHPLLVFGAILGGIKLAGFWGALFGIPVVGVIWAMLQFFLQEWLRRRTPQPPKPESPPKQDRSL